MVLITTNKIQSKPSFVVTCGICTNANSKVIVWTLRKSLFFVLNPKLVHVTTYKITPSLPYVLWHIEVQFKRYLFTSTQVIVQDIMKMLVSGLSFFNGSSN